MKAFNFSTMRPYSGANEYIEGNGKYPAFATFNQVNALGYQVKKGAKGIKILCGFRPDSEDDKTEGDILDGPRFRTSVVFDLCDTTASDDPEFMQYLDEQVAKITGAEVVTA